MKKLRSAWMATALVAGGLVTLASCAEREAPGEVVARVNGTPIYASSLDMELVRHEQRILEGGENATPAELTDPAAMGRFRAGALEKLIDTELLYQQALRTGHKVDPKAVDEQMGGLISGFESEERFEEALAELHIQRQDLWRDLEHGLAIQKLIAAEIEPSVAVTPEDARAYYDGHPELFTQPERVRARHILVEPGEGEGAGAKARSTLEELRRRALRGEDFATLATQYSQDSSASSGGDLGYFGRGEVAEPFERAAFALEVGELSGVVATPFGFHLIQLVDRVPPTPVDFDSIGPQLALYLQDQRVAEAVAELTRELRGKAEITLEGRSD